MHSSLPTRMQHYPLYVSTIVGQTTLRRRSMVMGLKYRPGKTSWLPKRGPLLVSSFLRTHPTSKRGLVRSPWASGRRSRCLSSHSAASDPSGLSFFITNPLVNIPFASLRWVGLTCRATRLGGSPRPGNHRLLPQIAPFVQSLHSMKCSPVPFSLPMMRDACPQSFLIPSPPASQHCPRSVSMSQPRPHSPSAWDYPI